MFINDIFLLFLEEYVNIPVFLDVFCALKLLALTIVSHAEYKHAHNFLITQIVIVFNLLKHCSKNMY